MARGLYIGGKPVWTTIPEINLLTGTPESIDLSAYLYNPRNRAITFSSVGSLPTGCSISGSSLNWNGNGTQQVTSATIRAASNQYQADATATFDIALGGNSPPEWSQYIGPFNVPSNSTAGYVVANMGDYVTDPENDTLTITMNGSLPSGLSYNSTTKQVTVTGALTAGNSSNVTFTADDGYVEEAITTLTLTGGSAGKAWTFGHPFKQGDVPSGSYITATGPASFQAEVRNRWADGSVKFAVLSGIGGTSAELRTTAVAPSGTNVAEPSTTATVQFSSPATTVSLATARANGSMAWTKSTAHKVREILGPVMSEFHYYSPVSGDNHLAVFWYVRAYVGGAVEVETVVENGWLNVGSPTEKSYTATVTVAGTQRYTAALTHLHHTRWQRSDWAATDPGVTPSHDGAYLRSTKLVPNYTTSYGAPSASALNALVQTAIPFAQAAWPSDMGAAGGGGSLLNNWDALYITSGDARAYRSVIANSQAAGRYGIHYRDETTGKPPLYSSYPTHGYTGSGIGSTGSAAIEFPTGGTAPPNYAKSHARPFGILAYLLTGRHSFREQVEFQAQVSYFAATYTQTYEGIRIARADVGAFTGRGAGWAIRSMAAAIVAVPDADANAAQYRTHLGKTLGYYGDNFTNQNNLGVIKDYDNYEPAVTAYAGIMQDSFTMGCEYAYQCANDALGSDRSRADAFVVWRCKYIVGRFGGQATDQYCYRNAATYYLRIAATNLQSESNATFNAGVYSNWGQVYVATMEQANSCNSGTTLEGTSGSDPADLSTAAYPYWGLAHTALAFAVDIGAVGASEAWSRFVAATNYAPNGFADFPLWGVVPR